MVKNCEICGKPIRGRAIRVLIEGAELEVCQQCSSLGTEVRKAPPPREDIHSTKPSPRPVRRPRRDVFSTLEEIVDDYPERVREARAKKGLSQEELAERISERLSLIKKIERGEFVPEEKMIKKLEHELDIKLTAPPSTEELEGTPPSEGTTLGDVVKIKRK
ncbi:MAG: multiprotein bridging factor aMBF1 [Methermicoccaceae archaeon]